MDYEDYVLDKSRVVKNWINHTVEKSKVEWLARQMGISAPRLYQQKSLTNFRDLFHLENLPILIHETGDFSVLDQIERLLGRVAFAIPQTRADFKTVVDEQVKAIKEFSEYVSEVAAVVADGMVTEEEFAAVQKEFSEAMGQMAALLETVRQLRHEVPRPALAAVRQGVR